MSSVAVETPPAGVIDSIEIDNIPDELKPLKQWVLWKSEPKENGGKPRKMPYRLAGGPAKVNTPDHWSTLAEIIERNPKGYTGIGFVFSKNDPYVGIDLDNCRDPSTGVFKPWAQGIVDDFGTYSEISPSSTGVKLWGTGSLPGDGTSTKYEGGAIEMYQEGRFFAVTGRIVGDPPAKGPRVKFTGEATSRLWKKHFGDRVTKASAELVSDPDTVAPDDRVEECREALRKLDDAHDNTNGEGEKITFHAGCLIRRYGIYGEQGFELLEWFDKEKCFPQWGDYKLCHKWDGACKKVPPREGDWNASWLSSSDPSHDFTDVSGGKGIRKFTLPQLQQEYPTLSPPVVSGLLRQGEVGNLIAASKVGKSWGAYGLGISVVMGWDWLDQFSTAQGKVLLIDNELQEPTLSHRIPIVWEKMLEVRKGIGSEFLVDDDPPPYGDFEIWPLRGNLRTLAELGAEFEKVERDYFKLIIFDAKYRFALAGVSENDNAAETQIYNLLNQYADKLNAAMILVHHSSKGDQSGKRVTDVGSGAGAQSRAADCHMVLREHEEPGMVVLDAAVRSFPPVEPLALKWEFPLWVTTDADTKALAGRKTRQDEARERNTRDGKESILIELQDGPATVSKLAEALDCGRERVRRLARGLIKEKAITSAKVKVHGNMCDEYSLAEDSE